MMTGVRRRLRAGSVPVKRFVVITALAIVASCTSAADARTRIRSSSSAAIRRATSCHLAPEGGGLLNENGDVFAENISQFGQSAGVLLRQVQAAELAHARRRPARGATATTARRNSTSSGFRCRPTSTRARSSPAHLRLTVTAGYRPPENGNEAATYVWSREHYLMWSQDPDGVEGLVRADRPVHADLRPALRRASDVHAAVRRHAAVLRDLRRRRRVHRRQLRSASHGLHQGSDHRSGRARQRRSRCTPSTACNQTSRSASRAWPRRATTTGSSAAA